MRFPMGARNQARLFYIKARGGNLYARIDANIMVFPERLFFSMKTWANPRGERNLDYDDKIYHDYKKKAQ